MRAPSRSISNASAVSGLAIAAERRTSINVRAGSPSIAITVSPARRPTPFFGSTGVALNAGLPICTAPMRGAGKRTPTRNAIRKRTIASTRFAVIPARITTARLPSGARLKLRASLLTAPGLPSSWPSMRTYPPKGSARNEYSVSPMRRLSRSLSLISMGRLPYLRTMTASADPKQSPAPLR